MSETYIGSLDQGTTSTRFMVFDSQGRVVSSSQIEHQQIFPRPGWVEHDPNEIWANTQQVIDSALQQADLTPARLDGIGITNQRETVVLWDRRTGQPLHNAIVWQDTRTDEMCKQLSTEGGMDRFRSQTGLPLSTYFAGPKMRWLLDHIPQTNGKDPQHLALGTIDSWLIWNLTGGTDGGAHLTDVTNASRTMLMDINNLTWSTELCGEFGVPQSMLAEIRSSVGSFGTGKGGPLPGVEIGGVLGDQHAALFGQTAFESGQAKNTYGTGCFMLLNTGTELTHSQHGLLTTLGYRIGEEPPVYALEGSIAMAGAVVQWLRDNLGIIGSSAEVEALAREVDDNGDVFLVPAFSGLFAPHWRPDARGVLVGLTRYTDRSHIARAALEATAFQVVEVMEAMESDSGVKLAELKVDGGMVGNELLMQFQSDLLGVEVVRSQVTETTALGAAYAGGLTAGVWDGLNTLGDMWAEDRRWSPQMATSDAQQLRTRWDQAVQRTLDWA